MRHPFLAAGAAIAFLSLPFAAARADCAADAAVLDDEIVAMETGAAPDAGMPATEHQQDVLSGQAPHETAAGPAGSAGDTGEVEAVSPHQSQVMRGFDEESRNTATLLLAEAQARADAGDEAGCQEKLEETRKLLPAE
jgi:hypothetical protein